MPYNVIDLAYFKNQIEKLKKKFHKIESDINNFNKAISVSPTIGARCQLGKEYENIGLYKARMKDSSSNIGKSGGFRVLYVVDNKRGNVVPCVVYHKRERQNLDHAEIVMHLGKTLEEYTCHIQDDPSSI